MGIDYAALQKALSKLDLRQKVYFSDGKEDEVMGMFVSRDSIIYYTLKGNEFAAEEIGKTVFLEKEEEGERKEYEQKG